MKQRLSVVENRWTLSVLFAAISVAALPAGGAQASFQQANAAVAAAPGIGSSANISGAVSEVDGGPEIDSFNQDAPLGAANWTANDTAIDSGSGAQAAASHTFGVTSTATTTTATASGNVNVQYSVPVRRVTSGSVYTARFEVSEPTQYSVSGSLTSSGQVNSGIFCCSSARVTLEPDIFEQDAQNGQSIGVGAGGILQPGDYSLTVLASAGIGFGAAIPPDVSGGASFNVTLVLSPPGPPPPPAPIVVQGGPEASNLNLQVDTTASGGTKYTFNDLAPLQISDPRCQTGPPIVCDLPADAPVTLALGGGNDTVALSGSATTFEGLSVSGEAGNDTLPAAPEADGGPDDDTITAVRCASTACVLRGRDGLDLLVGGPGPDILFPGGGSDVVRGEGGSDTVTYSDSSGGVEILLRAGHVNDVGGVPDTLDSIENALGSDFDDILVGDDGANRLEGGRGDDLLDGFQAADELIGGPGSDRVSYRNHPLPVDVTLNDALPNDGSVAEGDTVTEVESAAGTDGDDLLVGTAGPNVLEGLDGFDILVPGEGADQLEGGDGLDKVDYSGAPDRVVVNLFADDVLEAAGTHDAVVEIEDAVGSAFADIILGDDDASLPNRLEGGPGNDQLDGLRGPDEMIGGPDVDEVSYFIHSAGADGLGATVDLSNPNFDAGVAGEGDRIAEVENLVGSRFNDAFGGNDENNRLEGGEGDDGLFGLGGNDELLGEEDEDLISGQDDDDVVDGGPDGDILKGDGGNDTVYYGDRTASVSVDLRPGGSIPDGETGEGDDVDESFENAVTGTGIDILVGNDSANTLEGGDGDDTIEGRGGVDVLDGQEGNDLFFARDGVLDHVFCGPGMDDDLTADAVDQTDGECETLNLPAPLPQPPPPPQPPPQPPPANTPAGIGVTVKPVDATTLTFPVEVTFGAVTTPGMTIVHSSTTGPLAAGGFQLGNPPVYYFISTNAVIVPPITVCIDMTGITFPTQPPSLMHFDQVFGWQDITRRPVVPPTICGVSQTLSPFAVMSPTRTVQSVRCVVPNVTRKTLPAARKAIRKGRCAVGKVRLAYSAKVRTGRVISQRPKPRTRLRQGGKVNLVVSRGKRH